MMDTQWILMIIFLGGVFSSQNKMAQSVLEVTARPGDNITIYCDCKSSQIFHIVWYRYCTHENQPPLVLKIRRSQFETNILKDFPRFHLVKNHSSESYDLLITNMTSSYDGLYNCGTEKIQMVEKDLLSLKHEYVYGNATTRIIFDPSGPQDQETTHCGQCWMLLFTLCPVIAGLSSLILSLWTYQPCKKKGKYCNDEEERLGTQRQMLRIQNEDVWLASKDIQQTLKKKKCWSSDLTFCTYSPITVSGTGKNRRISMTVS